MTFDLVTLDDAQATNPGIVGAKAAGLGALRAAGFSVPDAVVLPVGIAAAWDHGPAPEPLRSAVASSCADLGDRVAVRSSATWEDGSTSAHAGATATVLDVSGVEAVLEAVRHCLDASAVAQRDHGTSGDVAIVIQRLVPAEWAGVAFTVDPVTGGRDGVRLAAVAGLGEALVQGEVIGVDVTVAGERIDGDLGELPAQVAHAVASAALEVEACHGVPQDVEWAWAGGELHLLQTRPVTVVPTAPRMPEGNNWQKDTAHYPEPMTPFGWSLLNASAEEIAAVFDEMGLLIRGLEEHLAGGEVYGRIRPAFGSADATRKPPPALVMGLAARVVPELRRRTATAREALAEGRPQRWLDDWHRRDRAGMTARASELAGVELAGLGDAALLDHLEALIEFTRAGSRIHFRLVMPLFFALYRLHRLVGDELGWADATIAGMLAGHSPATRSGAEAMAVVRAGVRSTPGAVEALAADPHHPLDALGSVDPALRDSLAAWMDEHGWALINYDGGVPVLAERPSMISKLVLAEPEAPVHDEADVLAERARAELPAERRAEFDAALAAARAVYPVREDNTIIVGDRPIALLRRWMLEAADRLVARGVLTSATQAPYLFVAELRAALAGPADAAELAELVARRRGEEAWARAFPGPAYVGEQGTPPDISKLPAPLRQVNEPVLWGVGHEYPPPTEVPDDPDVLLAGVPASPGVMEGTVRLVRSHHDMDRLLPGEILVCQVTSPAWAPVFPLASAVVADGGGALSHAAIAAREHGLPAVLGTGSATTTLIDGQRIRVDGTRGLVLAVEE